MKVKIDDQNSKNTISLSITCDIDAVRKSVNVINNVRITQ